MPKLEPPHSHHVSAALGWLELGNLAEAGAELDQLPVEWRGCPEALFVRWEIQAKRKDWVESLETARALASAVPQEPDGWVKQSYSLHELKRTSEAWGKLLEVEDKFSRVSIIPYNLACYACQLGDQPEALRRLAVAIRIGGKEQITTMALKDADLRPLWERIRAM